MSQGNASGNSRVIIDWFFFSQVRQVETCYWADCIVGLKALEPSFNATLLRSITSLVEDRVDYC